MSNAAAYYNTMLIVLDACALYQSHYYLYHDLKWGNPPSPDSYKILVKKHEGDMDLLRDKLARADKKRTVNGRALVRIMRALDIYNEVDAEVWCAQVMLRREDCDFRAKCRDWCKQELRKIEKSSKEPEKIMTFADFISRYEKLVAKRQSRKK